MEWSWGSCRNKHWPQPKKFLTHTGTLYHTRPDRSRKVWGASSPNKGNKVPLSRTWPGNGRCTTRQGTRPYTIGSHEQEANLPLPKGNKCGRKCPAPQAVRNASERNDFRRVVRHSTARHGTGKYQCFALCGNRMVGGPRCHS